MMFDFDDAVFVSYRSPTNGYLSYLKFASKVKSICRMSDHVMAGNPYLAEFARQVNANVTIVPTTIDTDKYTPGSHAGEAAIPTIGWTGSFSTVQHLDTLRPALQKLAQHAKFRLRVIGTPTYKLEGLNVEAMPWRAATELEDLEDDRHRRDAVAGRCVEQGQMWIKGVAVYGARDSHDLFAGGSEH